MNNSAQAICNKADRHYKDAKGKNRKETRMTKADIFMAAGWTGLAGLAASIAAKLLSLPDPISLIAGIVTIGSCWAMLFTRNADEFTRGIWTSAASLAFAALLIFFIGVPFLEGAYDGFTGAERVQDVSYTTIIWLAIAAFYVGLFWKRVRGGI